MGLLSRALRAVEVPRGPEVVDIVVPALRAALDGSGPALLPLPPDPAERRRIAAAVRVDEPVEHDDVALVVATSGSTGEAKGVLLSAAALRASAHATHDRLGGPGVWLLALPATHIAGLQVLLRSLLAGTRPVALDLGAGFDPAAFAAAAQRLPQGERRYTALVPTQLLRLLDAGVDVAGFDAVLLGGAAAPASLLRRAAAAGAAVVTTYGMSETSGGCVYDGEPLRGVTAGLTPDGRVRLHGPVLARGYHCRPDLTAAAFRDGWFETQDLGVVAPDGRLSVLGRADDVVVTGGEKVAAPAVEDALTSHPAVREAAVVGVDDPEWGQRLAAAVVVSDPTEPPAVEALREHVADLLGRRSAPRDVVVVGALPRLGIGKVDRDAVRQLVAGSVTAWPP